MKNTRIAFLLTQSLDSPTGLGRIKPLARELIKEGFDVEIYALHPDYTNLKTRDFFSEGVHIHYIAAMHVKKQGDQKSYYSPLDLILVTINATLKLTSAALRTTADIIHLSKPHPMNGIAGLTARYLKKKILITDCDDYEAGSGNFEYGWQRAIVAVFEKWVPKLSHYVTTNTVFTKNKLIAWGILINKILELPNGVDKDRFTLSDQVHVERIRSQLGLIGKRVVSYIGSLSAASHPVEILLDAFFWVHQSYPKAHLLIVGGGENIETLRHQASELGIADKVIFTGHIDPDAVVEYYQTSYVTVDPVLDDDAARGRSPLKLFESWITGTPFITGDVGDRRRLMGEPPAGLIVSPGDPLALADGILQVLSDENLSKELAQLGLRQVQEYTWDKLVKRLSPLYHSLSSSPARFKVRTTNHHNN